MAEKLRIIIVYPQARSSRLEQIRSHMINLGRPLIGSGCGTHSVTNIGSDRR